MSAHDYCKIISILISRPDSEVLLPLKGQLDKLLDHIDECDTCNNHLASVENPAELYELLGTLEVVGEITPEDQVTSEHLWHADARVDSDITRAMEEVLLPALPDHLSQRFRSLHIKPVQWFSAIDALRMLVHNWARMHYPEVPDVLDQTGDILCNDAIVIPVDTVQASMGAMAGLTPSQAAEVLSLTYESARTFPTIVPGINSAPFGHKAVQLAIVPYSPDDNLFQRWAPPRYERLGVAHAQ